jgi:polysaccharide biosynthesis/export protein
MMIKTFIALMVVAILGGSVAPAAAQPYRIGAGDVVQVMVWDNKDLDYVVFVRPDGKISLPLLGEIQAGGLTVAELTTRLTEAYSKNVRGPEVTVDVKEIKSRPIFFVGGFQKAGVLQHLQDLTLIQGITVAGGLLPTADLESAVLLRGTEQIKIDFVKLINQADMSQNVKLEPGDTIVIPVAQTVSVMGEVRTPGPLKYTSDLTVVKAIVQAGGFAPLAAEKRVTVLRGDGMKREKIQLNVEAMMKKPESANDVPLKPNDIIFVPERLF